MKDSHPRVAGCCKKHQEILSPLSFTVNRISWHERACRGIRERSRNNTNTKRVARLIKLMLINLMFQYKAIASVAIKLYYVQVSMSVKLC